MRNPLSSQIFCLHYLLAVNVSQKNIGDVDFQTIQALLNKTKESPIYKTVQKIDSQNFYKN